jgi:hypothetical protein
MVTVIRASWLRRISSALVSYRVIDGKYWQPVHAAEY